MEKQIYDEAFVNLDGLILFMHENLKEFSGEEIFCVVAAHEAIKEILFELNAVNTRFRFNGKEAFCAHLAVLRLREALGDQVSGRAANALTLCLEALGNKHQNANDEDGYG
ncbi:MAG: hypothetical protein HGA26_04155 [Chlorobiaceae bacterium]|nr:hypothetical protein [Chlorobiaceae bacterium]